MLVNAALASLRSPSPSRFIPTIMFRQVTCGPPPAHPEMVIVRSPPGRGGEGGSSRTAFPLWREHNRSRHGGRVAATQDAKVTGGGRGVVRVRLATGRRGDRLAGCWLDRSTCVLDRGFHAPPVRSCLPYT